MNDLKQRIQSLKTLEEERYKLEQQISISNKLFFDKLQELYRIANSVCQKINLDLSTMEKVFTAEFSFLNFNPYYLFGFNIKKTNLYKNNITFEYHLGNKNIKKELVVSLDFFSMSDRDFATLIRQRIKTYKSENKEKEKREAEKIIAQNEKAIKKLLSENEKLTKFVEKIKEEQNKRADEIVKRMQENLKKNEQKEEVQS